MEMKAGCADIIFHVMFEGANLVLYLLFIFLFKILQSQCFHMMTFWYFNSSDTLRKLKQENVHQKKSPVTHLVCHCNLPCSDPGHAR